MTEPTSLDSIPALRYLVPDRRTIQDVIQGREIKTGTTVTLRDVTVESKKGNWLVLQDSNGHELRSDAKRLGKDVHKVKEGDYLTITGTYNYHNPTHTDDYLTADKIG